MPILYYLPGYGGGPESTTYRALLAEFPETKVLLYDSQDAQKAFEQLKEQLQNVQDNDVFIGQSLGGFWAHHFALLSNQNVVLINPSFRPFKSLQKYGLSDKALIGFRKFDRPDLLRRPPVIIISIDDTVVNPAPVFERYEGKARFVYVEGGHQFRHYDVLFKEVRKMLETERPVSGKFNDVAVEEEVQILLHREDTLGGYDVLFEFWATGGITGVSAIFLKKDVAHLSDAEIILLIQQECQADRVTLSHNNDRYLFANYGFKEIN